MTTNMMPTTLPGVNPPVPSLDELDRMIARAERVVFRGVDWDFYKQLLDVVGEHRRLHLAYDGRDLEVMSLGPLHEDIAEFSGGLIELIAEELEIPWRSMASTTWERPDVARGVEADQCYYFRPEKLAAAAAGLKRKSNDVADYPNPDLAIEIDVSRPKVDRPGIYAALKVTEVWRFTDSGLTIERLTDQGTFARQEASGFLPIRAEEVARWVFEEDTSDVSDWKRRLRAWARTELAGRRPL